MTKNLQEVLLEIEEFFYIKENSSIHSNSLHLIIRNMVSNHFCYLAFLKLKQYSYDEAIFVNRYFSDFIVTGYLNTQLISIRKLTDTNNRQNGDKRSLATAVKELKKLNIKREEYLKLPYMCDDNFELNQSNIKFDKLAGVNFNNRRKMDDTVAGEFWGKFENKINQNKHPLKNLIDSFNHVLGHNIKYQLDNYIEIEKIELAHKHIIEVYLFLGKYFYNTLYTDTIYLPKIEYLMRGMNIFCKDDGVLQKISDELNVKREEYLKFGSI